MHAQELAALLYSEEAAEPFGFGLAKTENCSFFFPLPHLGHSIRSESERFSANWEWRPRKRHWLAIRRSTCKPRATPAPWR